MLWPRRDGPLRPRITERPRGLRGGAEGDVLPRLGDDDRHAEHLRRDGPDRGTARGTADEQDALRFATITPKSITS